MLRSAKNAEAWRLPYSLWSAWAFQSHHHSHRSKERYQSKRLVQKPCPHVKRGASYVPCVSRHTCTTRTQSFEINRIHQRAYHGGNQLVRVLVHVYLYASVHEKLRDTLPRIISPQHRYSANDAENDADPGGIGDECSGRTRRGGKEGTSVGVCLVSWYPSGTWYSIASSRNLTTQ